MRNRQIFIYFVLLNKFDVNLMERGLITIFLKRHDDLLKQVFQKILEIYAISIDYGVKSSITQLFSNRSKQIVLDH
jgi:hypothetical protein